MADPITAIERFRQQARDLGLLDEITEARVGITYGHHEVHEGDAFVVDFVDTALANNETIVLAFKTVAGTKRAHVIMEYSTLVGGYLELWEGPTWTAQTGAEQVIYNRKREASMKSSVLLANQAQAGWVAADVVNANPTGLNVGAAELLHDFYAWGKKEKIAGGSARDHEEFILKPDTTYAIRFTSTDNANKAQVTLNWYEHTDR